ncbi:MAG: hypothetical protein KDA41_00155 [Planctomycetales bacterium]|nr:hypothetical protein [Planctomycetales bacterium]
MLAPLRLVASLLLVFASAAALCGQGLDVGAAGLEWGEALLSMPEPPLGYTVSKDPLLSDDRVVGYQVKLTKKDSASKVIVEISLADLSERRARVAVCKGCVGSLAAGLQSAGFRMTTDKMPDMDNVDFDKPVVVELTFDDDNGKKIRVHKRLFFTSKGYDVSVLATDEADFRPLVEWAARIRPAASGW